MGKFSKEDLFREIGEIDAAFVEEAERIRGRRGTTPWIRGVAVAASLVFCVGLGYGALQLTNVSNDTANMSGGAMEAAQDVESMAEAGGGQDAQKGLEQCAPEESRPQGGDISAENDAMAEKEFAPTPEEEPVGNSAATPTGGVRQEFDTASDSSSLPGDTEDAIQDMLQEKADQEVCLVQGDAETLTWEQAREDAVYGRYVDVVLPEGYTYASGSRSETGLRVIWNKGAEEITISCRQADEAVSDWLVDADSPREYDLGLYTIPLSESVPPELIQKVSNATFHAEQVTLEIVEARACQVEDQGDAAGWRTNIGILYSDNVLVDIYGKGPSPEEIYALINLEN